MSAAAAIWLDWSAAATGLLTNAKIVSCLTAADLPDTDPQFIYQGSNSTFEATSIIDDAGSVPEMPFAVTVNGTPVTTSGTKWMAYDWGNPLQECIRGYFHGGASPAITLKEDILKFGHVIYNVANASVDLNNLDHSIMYDPFAGMQQQIASGLNRIVAHTAAGTSGAVQTITPGKVYFYEQLKRSSTGECKIRFRDPANGYAILNTLELGFTPSIYGTYADLWGSQSVHPDCTGNVLWGNTGYIYEPSDFIAFGSLTATTANLTTLVIG